jgi:hypothetical protein
MFIVIELSKPIILEFVSAEEFAPFIANVSQSMGAESDGQVCATMLEGVNFCVRCDADSVKDRRVARLLAYSVMEGYMRTHYTNSKYDDSFQQLADDVYSSVLKAVDEYLEECENDKLQANADTDR